MEKNNPKGWLYLLPALILLGASTSPPRPIGELVGITTPMCSGTPTSSRP